MQDWDWPFSETEVFSLSEAARAVVNATLADDEVLRASRFKELRRVLIELRRKYGQHPMLLETDADFTQPPRERVALYERAKRAALAGGWPTYTIRISLACVLLEAFGDAKRAMQELEGCRDETAACADKSEMQEWQELAKRCAGQLRTTHKPDNPS